MTDLLSRPRTGATTPTTPSPRSLPAAAAIGAGAAVAVSLVLCMAVAVLGWFLADAGAHGQTTDALRIGSDAWLLGHGATVAAGSPIGITPLGLSALIALVGWRCGRWAGRSTVSELDVRGEPTGGLGTALAVAAACYVAATVVITLLAGRAGAEPSLPRAVLGGLVMALVAVGSGLAAGSGQLAQVWTGLPGYVRTIVHGAVAGFLMLFGAATVAVLVSLAWRFSAAANVFSGLGLSVGDALMLVVVSVLVLPNAAALAVSYLAGPGFAVGTGTTVSVAAVSLGPLPAFPLLAALPGEGATPGWARVLLAVPPLCALVGAALAQRRYAVPAWDSSALRGFGSGLGAGVLATLLVCVAGGPMGTGRMAHIGASGSQVLVTLVAGMSIGGLLGGVLMAGWQRQRPSGARRSSSRRQRRIETR